MILKSQLNKDVPCGRTWGKCYRPPEMGQSNEKVLERFLYGFVDSAKEVSNQSPVKVANLIMHPSGGTSCFPAPDCSYISLCHGP